MTLNKILKNKIYFISGIGTDIGKTFLVEKICAKLQKEKIALGQSEVEGLNALAIEQKKFNETLETDELKKLEAYLDNLNKVKFGENTDFAPVKTKKGRKLRTDGEAVPRAPRKPRVKKISMDIDDDIETGIKKMVYRKRDDGNN